jgi:hypothetical protein
MVDHAFQRYIPIIRIDSLEVTSITTDHNTFDDILTENLYMATMKNSSFEVNNTD